MEEINNNLETSEVLENDKRLTEEQKINSETHNATNYIKVGSRPIAQATSIISIVQSVLVSLALISTVLAMLILFVVSLVGINAINSGATADPTGFAGLAGAIGLIVYGIMLVILVVVTIIIMTLTIKDTKFTSKTKYYCKELYAILKRSSASLILNYILFALCVVGAILTMVDGGVLYGIPILVVGLIYLTIAILKSVDLKKCKQAYNALNEEEKAKVNNFKLSLKTEKK